MGVIISGGHDTRVKDSALVSVQEAITDVTRQIEDLNWISLSNDTRGQNLDDVYDQRRLVTARIRLYRRRSPLAKQGALLLQHYVLGQGVSLRANNKRKVARIIDEFMNDPENVVTFTGHQAMSEALDSLFTDGNVYLVLFPDITLGTVKLGMLDPMFVEDVVTDPDNAKVPRWYKVRQPVGGYDFGVGRWVPGLADEFVYYRDWRNDRTDFAPPAGRRGDGLVYHLAINKRGKFGESELAAALDWLKAHKEFMENRASLNAAAAQIAWKKKRKAGPAGVEAAAGQLRSSLTQNINSWENNPPAAPASTLVQNDGADTEWMKTDTGGTAASADERIMRMMVGAGMGGIPNHYFGDEAAANLATATSMELPLLKTYEAWQTLLATTLQDLFEFVLTVANQAGRVGERDDSRKYADRATTPTTVMSMPEAPNVPSSGAAATREAGASTGPEAPVVQIELIPKTEPQSVTDEDSDQTGAVDWYVGIDFPPIVQKDINIYMAGVKSLFEMMPASNIESQKLAVELGLTALGVDVEEQMERIFPPELMSPRVINAMADMAQRMGPGTQANPFADGGAQNQPPPSSPPVKESEVTTIHEARVRRVLRIARDAQDALAIADGG